MATLRVKDRGAGPVIYGRWRHGGRMIERPIGRGWLVADGDPGAKPNGRAIGAWRERRGRPHAGHLTVLAAMQTLRDVQERWEIEVAGEEARLARAARERPTVAEAAERFLAWGATDDPHSDREAWKHSYALSLRSYVGRLVRVLGAERPIDEVTHDDLVQVLSELVPVRNGQPTGAAPTRKFLSNYALPLKGLFALAVREGWVLEDPAVSLPSYKPKRKRAGDPVRREEYLTPEEVWAVVGELESEQDRAAVLCMAMGGLRPGEAVALRWQDVDLRGSTFRIVESRTSGVTGTPKSGIGRGVPMTDEVAAALEVVAQREVMTRPVDRVFTRRGTGYLDLQALRDRFNAAQDAAGIAPRRELRQLRNTFGTVCAAEGVSLRTLQEWMGHESITTTERYASHMPRARDAALISAAFSAGRPGS
jgi:integrase